MKKAPATTTKAAEREGLDLVATGDYDKETRVAIMNAIFNNDPHLPELVRRAKAGELILDLTQHDTAETSTPQTFDADEGDDPPIVFDQILIRKLARRIVFGRPMDNHAASSALVVAMEYMRDEEDENARFNFFNYFMMELAPYLEGYDENLRRVSREALTDVHASEYGDSTHND